MKIQSMKYYLGVSFLLLIYSVSLAQIGGRAVYSFLNLPFAARTASLGGNAISVKDDDINLTFQNPSLLSKAMNNQFAFSYINYFSDINYGYTSYAHKIKEKGVFSAGLQFLNYGSFTRADETGATNGQFKAADYSFNMSYAQAIDSNFTIGASLKNIYSALEQYTSFGTAIDIAGTYYNARYQFAATTVIRNIGVQWKPYRKGNNEPLPFEIQMGISKKIAKAPFRISIVGQNLQTWDLTYLDPNNPLATTDPLTGETIKQNKTKIWGDKLMRHIVLGGELLLTKNFNLRIGYNYQRRKELMVDTKPGLVGFSFGFGIKISKFHLSYGRAAYHLAGPSNHFTLSVNFSEFVKK